MQRNVAIIIVSESTKFEARIIDLKRKSPCKWSFDEIKWMFDVMGKVGKEMKEAESVRVERENVKGVVEEMSLDDARI